MQSFQTKIDARRQVFLSLSAQIEGQLRDAYDRKFHAGEATQSSLATKLGVNRSAVHHRLMGHTNMTIETIADMVWALDCTIMVEIRDAATVQGCNHFVESLEPFVPSPVNSTTMSAANIAPPESLSHLVADAIPGNPLSLPVLH